MGNSSIARATVLGDKFDKLKAIYEIIRNQVTQSI